MPPRIDAGPLRERAYRMLFLGQSLSDLGNGIAPVALAFAVLEHLGGATELGLVLAARTVPTVVFLLAGGVFADRLPRRAVMVGSDLVRGLTQVGLAALILFGDAELWHYLVLQAANGTAVAFFNPASEGLVPQTVSPPRLQQANALLSLSSSTGYVVGPAIAGALVATVGPAWGLAADGATFFASAAFLARMPLPPHSRAKIEPFLRELRDGWQEFRSRTWLWLGVLYSSLGNMLTLAPFLVLGPVIAERSLGGAPAWALITALFAVGALLGDVVALRYRPRRPILAFGLVLFSLAIPPAALALGLPAAGIAGLSTFAGAGLSYANIVWTTTVQEQVPPAALSRVSAYDWFGSLAFHPVGLGLTGPAAALLGTDATLWIAAAWGVGSTAVLVAIPDVRRIRSRPKAEDPPAPLSSLPET